MWTCPKCERRFKNENQAHYCVDVTIDELFEGKPDNLILAFDKVLLDVYEFGDIGVGTSKNTVIFASVKAFLIVRPMSKMLDLKFYFDKELHSPKIHQSGKYGKKYYYHIRVKDSSEVDDEVISLLKKGYDFSKK